MKRKRIKEWGTICIRERNTKALIIMPLYVVLQKCDCPFPIAKTLSTESRSTSSGSGLSTSIMRATFSKDPGPILGREIVTITVILIIGKESKHENINIILYRHV